MTLRSVEGRETFFKNKSLNALKEQYKKFLTCYSEYFVLGAEARLLARCIGFEEVGRNPMKNICCLITYF